MTLRYPAIYKVACQMNIRVFPFDIQNCTLIFGSWAFTSRGNTYYEYISFLLENALEMGL